MARLSPIACSQGLFAGHQMRTPWDARHRGYFRRYALWTDLTTPFLLTMDGVRVESWQEGSELWRVMRAHSGFPLRWGPDVRRRDYNVGGFGAAPLA
jgi:hypothetical protein